MADPARITPTADVHPIPCSPYAPGEISPVIAVGVSYPLEEGDTAELPNHEDAELLDLIARHGTAHAAWTAADDASEAPREAYRAAAPPIPAALYWRCTDEVDAATMRQPIKGSTSFRLLYSSHDIERLRSANAATQKCTLWDPAPWNENETLVRYRRPINERAIARRAEILSAWDALQAEQAALAESTGLTAANAAVGVATYALNDLEDQVLDCVPRTFAGLQAKARWADSDKVGPDYTSIIMRDLRTMPFAGIPALRQSSGNPPDRRALEAYREWLWMEGRLLGRELFPELGSAAERAIVTTAASQFHKHPTLPGEGPSTRAESMCDMLGIDWRSDEPKDDRGQLVDPSERAA